MEAVLTGFDLLTFVNGGFVQFVFNPEGTFEVFVEDKLADFLTEQTGIEVTADQLVGVYTQFSEYLGSIKLSITPNQEGE